MVTKAQERRELRAAKAERKQMLAVAAYRTAYREGYRQFGVCTGCGRVRDEEEKLLYVVGRRKDTMKCLDCWGLTREDVR